jgi:peptidyl-prolyl cis-trans isomerase C
MRRWLREPLVQLLVLGLLLFALHAVLRGAPRQDPKRNRIALTVDDLRQLEVGFTAQWQRPPTGEEMVGLVENRIREDVLYREALALGLDKEDSIVKRRAPRA